MYKEYENSKLTKEKLKRIFILQATKQSIENISVNDMIKLAKINRSTFYIHYHNIAELILDIENDILKKYETVLKSATINTKQDFVNVVCDTAIAEANNLKIIINSKCFQIMLNSLRDLLAKHLKPFVLDDNTKEIKTIFASSGIVNVLRYCIANNVDINSIRQTLIDLIN